jgi:hypothetical protein
MPSLRKLADKVHQDNIELEQSTDKKSLVISRLNDLINAYSNMLTTKTDRVNYYTSVLEMVKSETDQEKIEIAYKNVEIKFAELQREKESKKIEAVKVLHTIKKYYKKDPPENYPEGGWNGKVYSYHNGTHAIFVDNKKIEITEEEKVEFELHYNWENTDMWDGNVGQFLDALDIDPKTYPLHINDPEPVRSHVKKFLDLGVS